MKRTYFILAALSLVLAGSCSRMEENVIDNNEPTSGTKLTFKATQGDNPETRTVRQEDGSIWWSKDDAINVFYGNAKGQFTTDIAEPAATASFTGTLEGDTEGASVYWGVYPYNENNTFDGTGVTLTIPSEQKGVPGTFADKLNPSVARSETESLSFYNVGSWFVFTVAGEGITSATFKGNNNEDIAGKVKVTMDSDGKPVAQVLEGVKSITITPEEGDAFVPGKEYRIVLLPQTMRTGYTITLYKGNLSTDCVVNKEAVFGRSMFRGRHTVDSGKWHGDYVDLGNGVLWATMNVGAASETDAGSYFAWGETQPKTEYSWSTYKYGNSTTGLTKYVLSPESGNVDNLNILEPSDDAATANWGGNWRTPSKSDWTWLNTNCQRTVETQDGVKGVRFTSTVDGFTDKSIFLPLAGIYDGTAVKDLYDEGVNECFGYWGSTLSDNSTNDYAASYEWSTTYAILCGEGNRERYLGLLVRPVCSPAVSVTGIVLSESSITMELGDNPVMLAATVSPEDATNQTVIWTCSDESVASMHVTGSSVAIGAAGVGTATITATAADGGYSATCTVTVTGVPVTGVTLDKTELTLSPGETYKLTATVSPDDASVKTVKWTSSNPDDVWVEKDGTVRALALNGSSTITVTTDNGGFTATCEVTVRYVEVTGITLDKTTLNLAVGQTATLKATVLPEGASSNIAQWSISDDSVVNTTNIDYDTGVATLKGLSEGTATITVATAGNQFTATCEVTVTAATEHAWVEMGVTSANGKVLKWATCNVGASKPEEYGDWFAWGETEPYYENIGEDGTVTWKKDENGNDKTYAWASYFDTDDNGSTFTTYNNNGGITILEAENDAATANWGSTWRMPTDTEWEALLNTDNFTWKWTDDYNGTGVAGRIVTSNMEGYKGNSIFLPAAGYFIDKTLFIPKVYGYYWSSSLYVSGSSSADVVSFYSPNMKMDKSSRYDGLSVRPVSE